MTNKPFILDGATGSNLIERGMPAGVCPEMWVIENESVLIELQQEYVANGSEAVCAPTLGAGRISLRKYGLDGRIEEINEKLVDISRRAVSGKALVMADISPSGLFMKPYGDAGFDDVYNVYREQALILERAGVDIFFVETQISLSDTRAAVLAIKEVSNKPVFTSMSVDAKGRTMDGSAILVSLITLESIGADAFGCNCSVGPKDMSDVIKGIVPYAKVPVIAKPNAGKPQDHLDSDEFTDIMATLPDSGVKYIGGCCGSTPLYIKKLRDKVSGKIVAGIDKKDTSGYFTGGKEITASIITDLPAVIECSESMEDDLYDAEELVRIKVNSENDADILLDSSYMISVPLMVCADNAAVLDRVLMTYCGKAVLDPECKLSDDELNYIKNKYYRRETKYLW